MELPIYWTDPKNCGPFTTKIVAKEGQKLKIEDGVIFPEGGGQPSDKGIIQVNGKEATIVHVSKQSGDIWIEVDNPDLFEVGSEVMIWVDHERRQILRQMHSGQHLFSAVLESEFNVKTTRALMSVEESEISTDIKLSEIQIDQAETLVNKIILENQPINSKFITREELTTINFRGSEALKEFNSDILRLVEIGDKGSIDRNPCGGTHLQTTSEIDFFVITSIDGKRIKFKCGKPAILYVDQLSKLVRKLRNEFSAKPERILEKVTLAKEELRRLRKAREKMAMEILNLQLDSQKESFAVVQVEDIPRDIFQKWKPHSIPINPICFVLENNFLGILGEDKKIQETIEKLRKNGFKGSGKKGKYLLKNLGEKSVSELNKILDHSI